MALKLNKRIKTRIADMAIRKKYKAEYERLMQALKDALYIELYEEFKNDDFAALPERALKLVKKTQLVSIRSHSIHMKRFERFGNIYGFDLHDAFDTVHTIEKIMMDDYVFGCDHRFCFPVTASAELLHLNTLLKEAAESRDTLIAAMESYKSANQMLNEMPWANEFYPEDEKSKSHAIVPLATISKANQIMGNNDEN